MTTPLVFSIDVESYGLYGEGFAVGVVVFEDGKEIDSFYASCPLETVDGYGTQPTTETWLCENVLPNILIPTHANPRALRDVFWLFYDQYRKINQRAIDGIEVDGEVSRPVIFMTDCGTPVEANFFRQCVTDDLTTRMYQAPYPLHDLGTLLQARSMNPIGTYDRLDTEKPAHNPLCDARQSGRLWCENA